MDKRIILSDNGVLTDYTSNMSNLYSGTFPIPIVAAEDKIFIGSRFAFNSFYAKVNAVNSVGSVMTVKYWDGSSFVNMVEVMDETDTAGASLAASNHITFVPNRDTRWAKEDTGTVTGLGSVTIYDHYWLEVTFSVDLSVGTILDFIGDKFASDNDLGSEFPDLNRANLKTAFETGKTDWEEQAIIASGIVIDDLIKKNIINSGDQLLDRHKLKSATVMKMAEIIFGAFGDKYRDDKEDARKEYNSRLNIDIFNVDRNSDARLDTSESRSRQGRIHR